MIFNNLLLYTINYNLTCSIMHNDIPSCYTLSCGRHGQLTCEQRPGLSTLEAHSAPCFKGRGVVRCNTELSKVIGRVVLTSDGLGLKKPGSATGNFPCSIPKQEYPMATTTPTVPPTATPIPDAATNTAATAVLQLLPLPRLPIPTAVMTTTSADSKDNHDDDDDDDDDEF